MQWQRISLTIGNFEMGISNSELYSHDGTFVGTHKSLSSWLLGSSCAPSLGSCLRSDGAMKMLGLLFPDNVRIQKLILKVFELTFHMFFPSFSGSPSGGRK